MNESTSTIDAAADGNDTTTIDAVVASTTANVMATNAPRSPAAIAEMIKPWEWILGGVWLFFAVFMIVFGGWHAFTDQFTLAGSVRMYQDRRKPAGVPTLDVDYDSAAKRRWFDLRRWTRGSSKHE